MVHKGYQGHSHYSRILVTESFPSCSLLIWSHSPGSFFGNNKDTNVSGSLTQPLSAGSLGLRTSWSRLRSLQAPGSFLERILASSRYTSYPRACPNTGKEGKLSARLFSSFIRHLEISHSALASWGGACWGVRLCSWRGKGSIVRNREKLLERIYTALWKTGNILAAPTTDQTLFKGAAGVNRHTQLPLDSPMCTDPWLKLL